MSEGTPAGTITRLDPQVNNENRVSVFIDGEFAFGVHEDLVVSHGLTAGPALTSDTVRETEAD